MAFNRPDRLAMAKHYIRVKLTRGLYRWFCTCGREGKRGYGYLGLAERYGNSHVEGKHK